MTLLNDATQEQLRASLEELRNSKYEFYPCKPDIFAQTYEEVA